MKVILKQNVDTLGQAGEIVDVKPGYARNFLVPKGFAMVATKANEAAFENEKRMIAARLAREKALAQEMVQKLEAISVTIPVATGEEDKLFGSVTSQDIAEYLAQQGHDIDKRKILLDEPIKALGLYNVDVKLFTDVIGKIKVWVVKK
ncbi:50S ribosomal protein L9 [bacterium]|nr:50S ribosomal protein L9 [bacterium]NUN46444.1 50S ribosomal protein L9 [bacterium]HMV25401.1 50S ribosomal protein L9 [bacterium]HMW33396.1 50S ribosomal protein L9 [bacterium]HMW36797.1 50S ribosomal protein L9 [bacterium]